MLKNTIIFIALLCCSFSFISQVKVEGNIINIDDFKPVAQATITLSLVKYNDTAPPSDIIDDKLQNAEFIGATISDSNGNFSLLIKPQDRGKYYISVASVDFLEKKIEAFSFPFVDAPKLGVITLPDIPLTPQSGTLNAIKIYGDKGQANISIAKQVYNVEKNLVAQGGTAIDAIRNVPILNVDVDGNILLRNSTPDIFIDNRPTTLTLDQIPIENVEKIEVITNPPAKYRASGSGIVNLIMKKNIPKGYQANLFSGITSLGGARVGGGYSYSNEQWQSNVFALINRRVSFGIGDASRNAFLDTTAVNQTINNTLEGLFTLVRASLQKTINQNNIIKLELSYRGGDFFPDNNIESTFAKQTETTLVTDRFSDRGLAFRVFVPKLTYIRKLPKEGSEFSTDVQFNLLNFKLDNVITTGYMETPPLFNTKDAQINVLQDIRATGYFLNYQSDLIYFFDKSKELEAGINLSLNSRNIDLGNSIQNDEGIYQLLTDQSSNYSLTVLNYSGYLSWTGAINQFSYQTGLRVENVTYLSRFDPLVSEVQHFDFTFPIQLFPSVFVSYKVSESQNVQLSLTRRIKRPSIRQLVPFVNLADTINVSRGNPSLRPEFSTLLDASYIFSFPGNSSLLLSYYFKRTEGLISVFQEENSVDFSKPTIVNTYINGNDAIQHGFEAVAKLNIYKWLDFVVNGNIYYSAVSVSDDINIERWTPFIKTSAIFKILKSSPSKKYQPEINLQIQFSYRGKANIPAGGSAESDAFNTGARRFGEITSSQQGFIRPFYNLDAGLNFIFFKRKATLNLSINDILRTRRNDVVFRTDFAFQNNNYIREFRVVTLNFSLRFGNSKRRQGRQRINRVKGNIDNGGDGI